MSFLRMTRSIAASPLHVYRALTDDSDVVAWMVPHGMTSEVHCFEPQIGGRFRISLTYQGDGTGKTSARTDTYHGRFVELVPGRRVVQEMEFETTRPDMRGVMTTVFDLAEVEGGTALVAEHCDVPQASRRPTTSWAGDSRSTNW